MTTTDLHRLTSPPVPHTPRDRTTTTDPQRQTGPNAAPTPTDHPGVTA